MQQLQRPIADSGPILREPQNFGTKQKLQFHCACTDLTEWSSEILSFQYLIFAAAFEWNPGLLLSRSHIETQRPSKKWLSDEKGKLSRVVESRLL